MLHGETADACNKDTASNDYASITHYDAVTDLTRSQVVQSHVTTGQVLHTINMVLLLYVKTRSSVPKNVPPFWLAITLTHVNRFS